MNADLSHPAEAAPDRVLVVAPEPFYQDRGTPIAVRQLLEALSELGHEVDLLTYPLGADLPLPGLCIHRAANPLRFRSVPIGLSARKLVLDAFLVARLVMLLLRHRYACIHAVEEAAFPAVALGRRLGIPVLYDMQSSLAEQLARVPLLKGRRARRTIGACERWLLRSASRVVASRGLATRARQVADGVEISEWSYPCLPQRPIGPGEIAAWRRSLAIPAESRVVLYCGTFEPYQGLPDLVRAVPRVIARHPDAVFVLVGAPAELGDGWSAEERRVLSSEAVRVVRRQPRDRIAAFLAGAAVVVSPRAWGGNLPLKIFDYLAAGRPIVATDIPTHRSILTPERARLVRPDAAGLADGLVRLLGDPAEADRLGRAGREYARQHLGRLRFLRAVAALYRSTAGIGPPDPAPPSPCAVAVVSHGTPDLLHECLESLEAEAAETVVVETGADDGAARRVTEGRPRVTFVAAPENPGYGAAVNLAVARTNAPYVLLLNADTRVTKGAVAALARHLDTHPRAAAVGPRLVDGAGRLQPSCFPFLGSTRLMLEKSPLARWLARVPVIRDRWLLARSPHDRPRAVPWVLGAAVALRREAFEQVGGFDPGFFLYAEEVDLCYRLKAAGWEVHFTPRATVRHHGGASAALYGAELEAQRVASARRFYRRHLSRPRRLALEAMIAAAMAGRLARDRIRLLFTRQPRARHRLRENVAVWARALGGRPS